VAWPWLRCCTGGFGPPRCCLLAGHRLGSGNRTAGRLCADEPAGKAPAGLSRPCWCSMPMASTGSLASRRGRRHHLVAAAPGTDLADPPCRRICPTLSRSRPAGPRSEAAAAARGRCQVSVLPQGGSQAGGPPPMGRRWQLLAAAGRRCPRTAGRRAGRPMQARTGGPAAGCARAGPCWPLRALEANAQAGFGVLQGAGRGRSDAQADARKLAGTCWPGCLVRSASLIHPDQ